MTTLIDSNSSSLVCHSKFIDANLLDDVKNLPLVERPEILIYGKVCRQQRNVGFFALPGTPGYKYSGQQTTVIDIREFPFLVEILKKVNTFLKSDFNGILVNMYENGERYISAHSDDEKDLSPVGVASIAFGAVRKFRIRDKKTKKIVLDVDHQPGDLLIMQGEFQKHFTHEIPIQKKIKHARISLTFRRHEIK